MDSGGGIHPHKLSSKHSLDHLRGVNERRKTQTNRGKTSKQKISTFCRQAWRLSFWVEVGVKSLDSFLEQTLRPHISAEFSEFRKNNIPTKYILSVGQWDMLACRVDMMDQLYQFHKLYCLRILVGPISLILNVLSFL